MNKMCLTGQSFSVYTTRHGRERDTKQEAFVPATSRRLSRRLGIHLPSVCVRATDTHVCARGVREENSEIDICRRSEPASARDYFG